MCMHHSYRVSIDSCIPDSFLEATQILSCEVACTCSSCKHQADLCTYNSSYRGIKETTWPIFLCRWSPEHNCQGQEGEGDAAEASSSTLQGSTDSSSSAHATHEGGITSFRVPPRQLGDPESSDVGILFEQSRPMWGPGGYIQELDTLIECVRYLELYSGIRLQHYSAQQTAL